MIKKVKSAKPKVETQQLHRIKDLLNNLRDEYGSDHERAIHDRTTAQEEQIVNDVYRDFIVIAGIYNNTAAIDMQINNGLSVKQVKTVGVVFNSKLLSIVDKLLEENELNRLQDLWHDMPLSEMSGSQLKEILLSTLNEAKQKGLL